MQYFGDFVEDATVYIPFNTFTSDDPSASATITNLADADIKVHKDGSVTQIVTDGATVAIDFDGVTGNHLITIDTSAHADYSTGSDYLVRIEGTTVDAATVNAWVGCFSIQNRYMRGTDSAALASGVNVTQISGDATAADNAEAFFDGTGYAGTNNVIPTVTTLTGHTAQTGDSFARIGAAGAGLTDLGGMSTGMKAEVNAEVVDVMNTDTYAEPGQGAPAATASLAAKLNYLYKSWRNKKDNDGTTTNLYADDATTVDQKQTTSEAAGTVTKGEWASGP